MQQTELTKEGELFFRQYLRSPRSVGSVIPSSRALGRGVAAETAWEPGQYVVELGGGTGSITMGLIERGIPRDRLFVLELDGPMHAYLKERLPGVNVDPGRRHPPGRDPGPAWGGQRVDGDLRHSDGRESDCSCAGRSWARA